jgi:pimeloyl-ACP methyl ester carboxylesterase
LKRLNDPEGEKRVGRELYTFGSGPKLRRAGLVRTFRELTRLQHCTTFIIGHAGGAKQAAAWAIARPDTSRTGLRPHTVASKVFIRGAFLLALRENPLHGFPKAASFDADASTHRMLTLLAHALIHELCHVAWKASATRRLQDKMVPEPFYRNERLAEVGWAFSQAVFGGGLAQLGRNAPQPSCPYGLGMVRWPGGLKGERILAKERATAKRWGETYITKGVVHMRWCHKFFTRAFWEKGGAMYADDFAFDWTVAIRHADHVDTAFHDCETREVREKPLSPGPAAPTPVVLEEMGFKLKKDGETSSDDSGEDEDAMEVDWF